MQINICLGIVKDLFVIYNFVLELVEYEKVVYEFIVLLEDYQCDFGEGVFEVLVVEWEEIIVGMVLYYMIYFIWKGKMLYLEDFVVQVVYCCKGIGEVLFDVFLEMVKSKDCWLVKWQVLDWNKFVINFYRKKVVIIEQEWWNGKIFL